MVAGCGRGIDVVAEAVGDDNDDRDREDDDGSGGREEEGGEEELPLTFLLFPLLLREWAMAVATALLPS